MEPLTDPQSILFQVKYTNRSSSNTTRTVFVANQRQALQCMHFDLVLLDFYKRGRAQKQSDCFWIKSSAKRAFGGCLGSKRR